MNQNYARACTLIELRKYSEALEYLRRAFEEDPENARILIQTGLCKYMLNDIEEAEAALEGALRLDPNADFAHYLFACIYHDSNLMLKAEKSIAEALRLSPNDTRYLELLARFQLEDDEPEAAKKTIARGLQISPDSTEFLTLQADVLQHSQWSTDARITLLKVLKKNPDDANAHASLGWLSLDVGETESARKSFLEALRIQPTMQTAQAGLWYAQLNRYFFMRPLLALLRWVWPPRKRGVSDFFATHGGFMGGMGVALFLNNMSAWWFFVWLFSACKFPYCWVRDAHSPLIVHLLSRDAVGVNSVSETDRSSARAVILVHAIALILAGTGFLLKDKLLCQYALMLDVVFVPVVILFYHPDQYFPAWLRILEILIRSALLYFALRWVRDNCPQGVSVIHFVMVWAAALAWPYLIGFPALIIKRFFESRET